MQKIPVTLPRYAVILEYVGKHFIHGSALMNPVEKGLINSRPCPENVKLRLTKAIEEKVVYLRSTCAFGPDMIMWHLKRYLTDKREFYQIFEYTGDVSLTKNSPSGRTAITSQDLILHIWEKHFMRNLNNEC
jgi:hypothetical protein